MSKYHKILIGLMFPIILALAAPGDSTLYQGFESSTYPVWPEGWRRFSLETTTDNYWMRSGSQARTGSACARCLGSAGTRNDDWMILRMIYPTTDSQNLRFYYRAGNSNFRESLEVWVSTTTPDPTGMTVRLAAFGFTTTTYTLRTVNLNGYINQPIYIGIHMVSPSQQSVRIDDVSGPRYPTLDVAPTAITTPSSTYLTTASFTPTAIVKNYGSQSTPSPNFSVACTIYNASGTAVYNTSQNVTPILPNNTRTVSFSATSLLVGNYTMVVRTLLSGDLQGLNNRMVRQLVVTNENEVSYDDGTPALANYYPTVGVGTGLGFGVRYISSSSTTCIIGVEVMLSHDADPPQPANNYFKIRIVDDEGPSGSPGTTLWTSDSIIGIRGQWNYVAIPNIVIPANDSYYIFWLQGENWTQCAGLALDASDNAPSGTQWNYDGTYNLNSTTGDLMIRAIEGTGVTDAQTISILAPTGTVNQGATLNPQAVIRNNSSIAQSIPVRFTISDGYADDTTVALNAGQEITVDFLQWTANTPGNFPVRCSTGLIGDMNVTNDTISGSVFVQNLDVQCLSIDDPAGAVNQGTVIAPKATIRNNGNTSQTFNVLFTITGGCSNTQSLTLGPGASQQVTFADWTAGPLGTLGTKCTTQLVGDMNTTNDQSEGSVLVQSGTSAPSTWQRMADIPTQPSGKNSKAGSCVTGLDDKIYFLKASNTQDFHIYTPDNGIGTWTSNITDTIPIGTKEAGDGKKPKKGASMAAYQTALYVLRGNNTPGFWKFQTDSTGGDTFGWHKLANIPTGAKNPKDASSLIKITKGGIDNIFAMKGSRTDEFYLYDIATNTWTPTPTKPTAGNSGKIGYKKGSYLTYDGNNYVYVLKGSYGDFFLYDLSTETWTELKRYNHKFFINRDGKKKKIGEGSGMVYCDNAVYLLKGGNTREFWKYNISADTWVQMNPSDTWDIPIGDRNKKVKGGGSLILAGDYLYATKGANTPEFYRHTLPTSPSALTPNRPASEGTMGNGLIKDGFKLTISPNPANNITALSYNLSAPGPVNFKLYNVAGVLLKAYTNSSPTKGGIIMIDASTLSSGIYILRFNSGDLKVTRKLVLEK